VTQTQRVLYWFVSLIVMVSLLVLWGLFSIPSLIMGQMTLMTVTIFLHRSQAHRKLRLHPVIEHWFRFWNWLTTGMVTKEWVAIHRKHHRFQDTKDDPHTPVFTRQTYLERHGRWYGELRWFIRQVVTWGGVGDYRRGIADGGAVMLERFGRYTPDDWLERHVYAHPRWRHAGVLGLLPLLLLIGFGWFGILLWLVQVSVVPVLAAGMINGVGHSLGYRTYQTNDQSRNISPIAIFIAGEELHNNHHGEPANPKLSRGRWEFDAGWLVIRLLMFFRLARVV
jgi:stearoyl-CoA desaturase (delta-9 desaturase)